MVQVNDQWVTFLEMITKHKIWRACRNENKIIMYKYRYITLLSALR
jgi:hypothetical protein